MTLDNPKNIMPDKTRTLDINYNFHVEEFFNFILSTY